MCTKVFFLCLILHCHIENWLSPSIIMKRIYIDCTSATIMSQGLKVVYTNSECPKFLGKALSYSKTVFEWNTTTYIHVISKRN